MRTNFEFARRTYQSVASAWPLPSVPRQRSDTTDLREGRILIVVELPERAIQQRRKAHPRGIGDE